ncbi:hypothetical protein ACP275_02G092300 [Erythranthe tilingii]
MTWVLPDELWRRIMEIGIESKTLDHKSLCCLSITCRRLHHLAGDDTLWSPLLLSDFPFDVTYTSSSTSNGIFKSLYQIRYARGREQKRLAHRRAVLRIESEIAERSRKIQEIEHHSFEEKEKLNKAVSELVNLHRISFCAEVGFTQKNPKCAEYELTGFFMFIMRQASVALNVWQPEIIRGRQRQIVQQSSVPIEFRVNSLQMELNLCKQQIAGFDKALRVEKRRLNAAKEELASVKYHPIRDFGCTSFQPNDCRTKPKKLKRTSNASRD